MAFNNDQNFKLNFQASFSDDITPFTISVSKEFLEYTKLKVSLTRFVDDFQAVFFYLRPSNAMPLAPSSDAPKKHFLWATLAFF